MPASPPLTHHPSPDRKKRVLSVFTLVMINLIAIDSLRNLPANAAMGLHIVFFYLLIGLGFLLPCALVTAELATHWPKTGGAYVWIKEAFGARLGFLAAWLQWSYNIFWYPTILSFIAVNLAYLINPALATNKLFLLTMILGTFTIATVANGFGMRISGWVSAASAVLGTMVPMLFIIGLGMAWVLKGKVATQSLTLSQWVPHLSQAHHLPFLIIVLFSLMGLEMSAIHAEEVKNPSRDYPRALLYSATIILMTMILASAAIAMILPGPLSDMDIIAGLDKAYSLSFQQLHLPWLFPITVALIVLGAFGGMAAWVIGPPKALRVAAKDNMTPSLFSRHTQNNVPVAILILQWIVVLSLCCLLLFFQQVSSWYWILSAISAQLAILFYILLFAAAIRLRYKATRPRSDTAFRIPGEKIGIWIVGGAGLITCTTVMVLSFAPPDNIPIRHPMFYIGTLIAGIVIVSLLPFWIARKKPPTGDQYHAT